eukprot:3258936-Rhodomonas_salina.1
MQFAAMRSFHEGCSLPHRGCLSFSVPPDITLPHCFSSLDFSQCASPSDACAPPSGEAHRLALLPRRRNLSPRPPGNPISLPALYSMTDTYILYVATRL